MRKASNNLLRDSTAALRGAHSLAYLQGMWLRRNLKVSLRRNSRGSFSRSLRATRLAFEPLATVLGGFQYV